MQRYLIAGLALAGLASAQEFKVGSTVSDFTVTNPAGAPVHYTALRGGVTVVLFIATQCPVSNSYNDRMNAVYDDYSAKGVKFVFINANVNESAAEVAEHARKHGFHFTVYKDDDDMAADRFGANVTPEAFVMDASGTVRYHGYVDDSMAEERVHTRGLRLALDAVLAGQPVARAQTKVFGCSIKRRRAS
jgi:cytochrome oxidase Cu insertion factor (SCO1/SenC/PrrC family)